MRVMVQPLSELLDGDSTAYFSVVKVCSAASVSLVDDGVTDFVCNSIIWLFEGDGSAFVTVVEVCGTAYVSVVKGGIIASVNVV